jgi:hypothetical protein
MSNHCPSPAHRILEAAGFAVLILVSLAIDALA